MPDDTAHPDAPSAVRVGVGELSPLFRSLLVELIADAPGVILVEEAPIDVLLLEAPMPSDPGAVDRPGDPSTALAVALAGASGPAGFVLVERSGACGLVLRVSREPLDLATDARATLLAAIRRAAASTASREAPR